ncbi:MAG: hypothetical protein ACM37V_10975 [Gemmatimonadota bacterium]
MPLQQWARLQTDVNVKLRRGAWYRVIKLGAVEAVLDVNRKPLSVTRTLLQIVQAPPSRWSVVPAPRNALRFPTSWGKQYGVCPACRGRSPLEGHPSMMRCTRCNGLYEVAWNEPYLLSA